MFKPYLSEVLLPKIFLENSLSLCQLNKQLDQSEVQFLGIHLNKCAIHNIWFGKKRTHSCKQRTSLTFSFKKSNDPFENELFPFECILHVNYGKTDSLCRVSPPSPSFSALPSLDRLQLSALKVLTTRGARRTAWTWRCLGSYARRHDKHESLFQTDRAL